MKMRHRNALLSTGFSSGKMALVAVVHRELSTEEKTVREERELNRSIGRIGRLFSRKKLTGEKRSRLAEAKTKRQVEVAEESSSKSGQVIEFKFDLIVDLASEQEESCELFKRKLEDNINESVESFVLDSGDVCILSLANNKSPVDCSPATDWTREPQSIGRLATHTLAYAFQLLQEDQLGPDDESNISVLLAQGARRQVGVEQQAAASEGGSSIELSATLFLIESSATDERGDKQFVAIDLLDEEEEICCDTKQVATTRDCPTFEDALAGLREVGSKLNKLNCKSEQQLLMIGLKLKKRVNGGLFTNRLSLLHFDPSLAELRPILETIASGQALSYLKKRRLVEESSQRKLFQLEWMLYKQLSSALMRTLVIVHVRKLLSDETGDQVKHGQELTASNLLLLEFARSLQRASALRLKRRKRHLKSHVASSNASVASNASATTTANEILANSARHQQRQLHRERSATSMARKTSMDMSLALARHQRRHRYHQSYKQTLASDLTESSSISTSSGSQTRPIYSSSSRRTTRDNLSSLNLSLSEDSDSVTSANLNSYSSNSFNRLAAMQSRSSSSSQRRDIELRWMAKQSTRRIKQNSGQEQSGSNLSPIRTLAATSSLSNTVSKSSVIQIDCQPANLSTSRIHDGSLTRDTQRQDGHFADENADNFSDVCCMIAEPPKQLKLEEFLSQLSTIIAPMTRTTTDNYHVDDLNFPLPFIQQQSNCQITTATEADVGNRVQNQFCNQPAIGLDLNTNFLVPDKRSVLRSTEDDDEDCKSHSSILEHLSSLALESNNKRNHVGQLQDQNKSTDLSASLTQHPLIIQASNFELPDKSNQEVPVGHLRRLLNCNSQLSKSNSRVTLRDTNGVEEQLRNLSIMCQEPTSPSISSGAFMSSNNSSCSLSSTTPTNEQLESKVSSCNGDLQLQTVQQTQLYATVIRNQQNVKI